MRSNGVHSFHNELLFRCPYMVNGLLGLKRICKILISHKQGRKLARIHYLSSLHSLRHIRRGLNQQNKSTSLGTQSCAFCLQPLPLVSWLYEYSQSRLHKIFIKFFLWLFKIQQTMPFTFFQTISIKINISGEKPNLR